MLLSLLGRFAPMARVLGVLELDVQVGAALADVAVISRFLATKDAEAEVAGSENGARRYVHSRRARLRHMFRRFAPMALARLMSFNARLLGSGTALPRETTLIVCLFSYLIIISNFHSVFAGL